MRSKLLKPSFPVSRSIALVLIVAVVAASGCRWFRKDKDVYAQSPESRPLEVPPDLDMPNTDGRDEDAARGRLAVGHPLVDAGTGAVHR